MKKIFLLLLLVTFSCSFLIAQNRVPGDILIQLKNDATIETVVSLVQRQTAIPVLSFDSPAPRWRIYTLHLDPSMADDAGDGLLKTVLQVPGVAIVQWNNITDDRNTTPDDTEWLEQRDMGLIRMTKAWENTTGGLTPAGDTVVVAVLEKGMQKENPDLIPNLWRSWGEIPGNNKDDDGNGYIDDRTGWDAGARKGDGNGTGSSHGTSVCGIVGAKGNNTYGVTGVSWNVKILTVVNVRVDDEILAAYYYAGEMRRLYNTTNGQKGAFVVATNASFGFDNDRPSDHPLWCPVFDSLGHIGVLGVAATANAGVDVDEVGDMPTNCTSEFLITVTNLDAITGKRMSNAGFGPQSIDLGAPGQGTFTTTNRVTLGADTLWHGTFSGTSAACPHVSGTVGLLYSVNCQGFVADARTQPQACAQRVRDAILHNVVPEPTLADVTTTGGRLDVSVIVDEIMKNCAGTVGDLEIYDLFPNPVRNVLTVRYQTPDYGPYTLRVYNTLGQIMYDKTFNPPAFAAKIIILDDEDHEPGEKNDRADLSNWAPGVYFLTIWHGKNCETKKFVKY
jgi:subtilisin family serine protease